jgi:hypothetical protein
MVAALDGVDCKRAVVLLLNALKRRQRADRRALLLEVTEVVEQ